jgi:tripartite-type tricarboxylate transporter receptor subunit TctC
LLAVSLLAAAPFAGAQAAPSFEGKVINVYISSSVGGGLDLYARSYARHVANFLPGKPTMVPRNMPGAGGLQLANQLATTLPKDGTAVAALTNGLYLSQLLGTENITYDATKFNWVGRLTDLALLLLSSQKSEIKVAEDMLQKEFSVSVTGPGSYGFLVMSALKNIYGGKLKLISGYPSGDANRLAMERGEVDGTASVQWTLTNQREWILRNNANILAQIALTSYPELTHVRLLGDLAKDEETKRILNMFVAPAEIGRGFALPPDVPADIVEVHRAAFMQMGKDPAFLAEAAKQTLDINLMDGATLQALVIESGKVSPQEIAKARAAVAANESEVKKK